MYGGGTPSTSVTMLWAASAAVFDDPLALEDAFELLFASGSTCCAFEPLSLALQRHGFSIFSLHSLSKQGGDNTIALQVDRVFVAAN